MHYKKLNTSTLTLGIPLKQSGVSPLSLLLLILSSSRDGGSAGILVIWLSARFSFFKDVRFYETNITKFNKHTKFEFTETDLRV